MLLGMFQRTVQVGYDRLQLLHFTFVSVIAWAFGAAAGMLSYKLAGGARQVGPDGLLVLSNVPPLLVAGLSLFFVVAAITGVSVAMLLTARPSATWQES